MAERATSSPPSGRTAPLVGREREQSRQRAAFNAALAGHGRVVLVAS